MKSWLFALVFVPVTFVLGVWQYNRGLEKEIVIAAIDAMSEQEPITITSSQQLMTSTNNYQPVKLKGRLWTNQSFLLDNQVRNGIGGYQVLTPLELENNQRVLINRGWIQAPLDREQLPEIGNGVFQVEEQGTIYFPKPFTLKRQQIFNREKMPWPKRIQAIEVELLASYFEGELFDYTIRIHPDSPLAYDVDWEVNIIPPRRHYGYAFQWFALSLVLLVMTMIANTNILKRFK